MGDDERHGTRNHLAVASLLLAVNTAAIAVISGVVVYYMNEGAIGNIMGPVAIGVA